MSDTNHQEQTTKKVSNPFFTCWLVFAGLFGLFLVYQLVFELPKAEKAQAQLEIEFKAIPPLPNATLVKYSASHKTNHALVSVDYSTGINPYYIFKYYDEQLKQHGWQFQGKQEVTDWDKDQGLKITDYCKGDYGVELFYVKREASRTYAFNLGLDWNLNDCQKNK